MIYNGEKRAHLYKGDAHPAEMYKGDRYITGWQTENKTGELMEFSNTYNANFDHLTAYGMSEQKKYNGYNLLNGTVNDITAQYNTTFWHNVTNEVVTNDGRVCFHSTATLEESTGSAWAYAYVPWQVFDPRTELQTGETYTITALYKTVGYNPTLSISLRRGDSLAPMFTRVGTERREFIDEFTEWVKYTSVIKIVDELPTSIGQLLYIGNIMSTVNKISDIYITDLMIEKGNTAHEYEPYTGGKPSPSFEYPQAITDLNFNAKVAGANMINLSLSGQTSKYALSQLTYDGDTVKFNTVNNWGGDYAYYDTIDTSVNKVLALSWVSKIVGYADVSNSGCTAIFKALDADGNEITDINEVADMSTTESSRARWGWSAYNTFYRGYYSQSTSYLPMYNDGVTPSIRTLYLTDKVKRIVVGFRGAYSVAGVPLEISKYIVNYGVTPRAYEPYKAPTEYAVISRGIKVSINGNYTDANGQQWYCDTVDIARGIYTQRVKHEIFTFKKISQPTVYGYRWYRDVIPNCAQVESATADNLLCTTLRFNASAGTGRIPDNDGIRMSGSYNTIVAEFKDDERDTVNLEVAYMINPIHISISTAFKTLFPTTVITSNTDRIEATAKVVNMED